MDATNVSVFLEDYVHLKSNFRGLKFRINTAIRGKFEVLKKKLVLDQFLLFCHLSSKWNHRKTSSEHFIDIFERVFGLFLIKMLSLVELKGTHVDLVKGKNETNLKQHSP